MYEGVEEKEMFILNYVFNVDSDKKGEVLDKGSYNWKVNYKGVCTFGETIEEEGTVRLY